VKEMKLQLGKREEFGFSIQFNLSEAGLDIIVRDSAETNEWYPRNYELPMKTKEFRKLVGSHAFEYLLREEIEEVA
jgi:hypothetical protein